MGMHGVPQGITNPPSPLPQGGDQSAKAPGTLVLVLVFLAAFVVYYFVNWKLLSALWQVG